MDFLAEGNVAGQNLLRIVSRGSAIIAEMLRLSDHIPPVFLDGTVENLKYARVLFDFTYLKNSDLYETRLSQDQVRKLKQLSC
jgi:WASH complex subunit strumpellin